MSPGNRYLQTQSEFSHMSACSTVSYRRQGVQRARLAGVAQSGENSRAQSTVKMLLHRVSAEIPNDNPNDKSRKDADRHPLVAWT